MPLDPGYPAERLATCWKTARRVAVLTHGATGSCWRTGADVPVIDLEATQAAWRRNPENNPDRAAVRTATAAPGLCDLHLGIDGRAQGGDGRRTRTWCGCCRTTQAGSVSRAQDVWTLFHSFAFDFSVWEIWGAAAHGGRLMVVPHAVSPRARGILPSGVREGVTVLQSDTQCISASEPRTGGESARAPTEVRRSSVAKRWSGRIAGAVVCARQAMNGRS